MFHSDLLGRLKAGIDIVTDLAREPSTDYLTEGVINGTRIDFALCPDVEVFTLCTYSESQTRAFQRVALGLQSLQFIVNILCFAIGVRCKALQ